MKDWIYLYRPPIEARFEQVVQEYEQGNDRIIDLAGHAYARLAVIAHQRGNVDVAADITRFDLGSGWDGQIDVQLTTSNYGVLTTLGFALTTDATPAARMEQSGLGVKKLPRVPALPGHAVRMGPPDHGTDAGGLRQSAREGGP
ncbi:MAG: hypothetical protein P8Y30_02660, partial [candidate division WOR-3 bacterium]